MGWYGLDWSDLRIGPVDGSCKHGSEPSGSIKCLEILEWLSDWRLLKKTQFHGVCWLFRRTAILEVLDTVIEHYGHIIHLYHFCSGTDQRATKFFLFPPCLFLIYYRHMETRSRSIRVMFRLKLCILHCSVLSGGFQARMDILQFLCYKRHCIDRSLLYCVDQYSCVILAVAYLDAWGLNMHLHNLHLGSNLIKKCNQSYAVI
jgi:hypothetical protein